MDFVFSLVDLSPVVVDVKTIAAAMIAIMLIIVAGAVLFSFILSAADEGNQKESSDDI